ncbi:hypothetical protein CY35_18G029600 [Sphagnum magellanicum]|jgi:hypothetical protein|nr:hypothetical protein CY35_18G029600 [Sphagnum magellanicum]
MITECRFQGLQEYGSLERPNLEHLHVISSTVCLQLFGCLWSSVLYIKFTHSLGSLKLKTVLQTGSSFMCFSGQIGVAQTRCTFFSLCASFCIAPQCGQWSLGNLLFYSRSCNFQFVSYLQTPPQLCDTSMRCWVVLKLMLMEVLLVSSFLHLA